MLASQAGRYGEFHEPVHRPLAYLLTQPGVILHYLRLACWPTGQCLDYDWPIATTAREILLPAGLIVAAAAVTAVGTWRRRPWAWPAAAFFLLLAPTSSLLPVAAPAVEHRMYLPLAAVAGLVIVGGFALVRLALDRGAAAEARPAWPWVFAAVVIAATCTADSAARSAVSSAPTWAAPSAATWVVDSAANWVVVSAFRSGEERPDS